MEIRYKETITLLLCFHVMSVMAEECASLVGVVIGSIAGTLVFVFIILLIVYLCHRKSKKGGSHIKHTNSNYDNPTFNNDLETGLKHIHFDPKQTGFEGYMVCREYLSRLNAHYYLDQKVHVESRPMQQNQVHYSQQELPETPVLSSKSSLKSKFAKTSMKKSIKRLNESHRTGSHASLDNNSADEAKMVSVFLECRDPHGFGIFIDGNMRDGIFISQVLNRGPAKETGLIQKGDRILNMTISMENMVLEDALTIVSYASPYPVRLLIRKPAPPSRLDTPTPTVNIENTNENESDTSDWTNLNYRSQSLNDLTVIVKDTIIPCAETSSIKGFSPRRVRSEIKRPQMKSALFYDTSTASILSLPYNDLSQQDHLDLVKLSFENENQEDIKEEHIEDIKEEHIEDIKEEHKEDIKEEHKEDIKEEHNEDIKEEHNEEIIKEDDIYKSILINEEIEHIPEFNFEINTTSKSLLRSENETHGGISYFVDIDEKETYETPKMMLY